jgi:hypothetical protein
MRMPLVDRNELGPEPEADDGDADAAVLPGDCACH